MHEEALLRDLLGKLDEVAATDGASRVTRVRVRLGALAHLTESGLRNRWPAATQGTRAEDSVLEVVVSSDPRDPRAGDVVLESVDVAGGRGRSPASQANEHSP